MGGCWVAFECQHGVGIRLDNLLGDVRLTPHGVEGDDASLQFQEAEQLGVRPFFDAQALTT